MSYSFFNKFPDQLLPYASGCEFSKIQELREKFSKNLMLDHWQVARDLFSALDHQQAKSFDYTNRAITVETNKDQELIKELVRALIPWRKGPFKINDLFIDSEWQSNLKWDRVVNQLAPLENKFILDIGCNNAYYMFRMLEQNPRLVVGLEPSERCWFQYQLFQHYIKSKSLQFELFGVEHVQLFPNFFHTVLCMGIIYHQRSPIEMLRNIHLAMRKNAEIIVETLAITGEQPYALCVPERYAKMHNVFFIPTVSCLESWMIKAKFSKIELISQEKTGFEEQRKTEFAPFESLAEFLDPLDSSKTVEGYPAPMRIVVKARKI